MVRYDCALLATSCIEYLRGTTYEKPHCARVNLIEIP